MRSDIRRYVQTCGVCLQYKAQNIAAKNITAPGLLQPLPHKVWTSISMEFVEGLPLSQGKSVIMVVVDTLSKYNQFIAMSHLYEAVSVAQLFLDHIFKLHGLPKDIVSARDPTFNNIF